MQARSALWIALWGLTLTMPAQGQSTPPLQWLRTGNSAFPTVACAANGAFFVGSGNTIQMWNLTKGAYLGSLPMFGKNIAVSSDGSILAAVPPFGTADSFSLLSPPAYQSGPSINALGDFGSVAVSANGQTLVCGGEPNNPNGGGVQPPTIEVWNTVNGKELLSVATGAGYGVVPLVAISADGSTVAEASGNVAKVYDVASGNLIDTFSSPSNLFDGCLAFSPDGKSLAIGTQSYSTATADLEIWSVATGKQIASLATKATGSVNSVIFSSDGKTLAAGGSSASRQGVAELWTVVTGKVQELPVEGATSLSSLAYGPNNTYLFGGWNQGVLQWKVSTGSLLPDVTTSSTAQIVSTALSADGQTLVVGGYGPSQSVRVSVWSALNNKPLVTLPTNLKTLNQIALSPDGSQVVSGGVSTGGFGALERIGTNRTGWQQFRTVNTGSVNYVAYSPDGTLFADSGYEKDGTTAEIEIWSTATGNRLVTINPASANIGISTKVMGIPIAFSPDGRTLACGIGLWDTSTGKFIKAFNSGAVPIQSLAFTPTGASLALDGRGQVQVWNIHGNTLIMTLWPTANFVTSSVGYSPDGGALFVASSGPAVSQITEYDGHGAVLENWTDTLTTSIPTLALSSGNGSLFAYGGYDGLLAVCSNPFAIVPKTLSFYPNNVTAGSNVTCSLTLSAATPIGAIVDMGSVPTLSGLPASISLTSGNSLARFTFIAPAATSATTYTVTASYNGAIQSATLTVQPSVSFKLALSPTGVTGGGNSTATVTLTQPAPAGGLSFALTSNSTAVPSPVGTVVVAAGKTSGTATVATEPVTSAVTARITATLGTTSTTASLVVKP